MNAARAFQHLPRVRVIGLTPDCSPDIRIGDTGEVNFVVPSAPIPISAYIDGKPGYMHCFLPEQLEIIDDEEDDDEIAG